MNLLTLRDFDQLRLAPVEPLVSTQFRRIREKAYVSQVLVAPPLNRSLSAVQTWQINQKKLMAPALKHLVQQRGFDVVA